MLILAFDTTSPEGGVALYRDDASLGDLRADGKGNYSIALFEMTDQLLANACLRLEEVEVFAAASGPGSFTGIRVGLAAAQGWAKAFGRPVRGVSVLEAMVEAALPHADVALPLVDARRGEFYGGVFRRAVPTEAGSSLEFVLAGDGFAANAERIASLAAELTGSGKAAIDMIIREHDQAALELAAALPSSANRIVVPGFLAPAIASVALRASREGRLQQPQGLDAWYIRRSDAEMNWRE
ncbi:MAG TPA: tRNA (adenosine(37)-N6)-threonylcarbamoyltransferase complex dimerization subunit type 1 TsaB [Terriglobia bacterium]|nr:tRNA (adenosine(37)-N6)-threonylcarbamoyltransferase complex dimerization subunit type 1 TsaB [Terriglobia bacterium]